MERLEFNSEQLTKKVALAGVTLFLALSSGCQTGEHPSIPIIPKPTPISTPAIALTDTLIATPTIEAAKTLGGQENSDVGWIAAFFS